MNEKTINAIMEELTELYETKKYYGIKEYYIYPLPSDDTIIIQFAVLCDTIATELTEICKKHGCSWVVQMHLSKGNTCPVNIYRRLYTGNQ